MIDGSYLDARPYSYLSDRGGIEMTFHSQHRPLSAYFAALASAGLLVENLWEPRMSDDLVEEDPSRVRWRRLPLYLFVSCMKPPSAGPPRSDDGSA